MKFIAGFDLTNPLCPQSGQFSVQLDAKEIFCRFSVIVNQSIQTGVLRLLRTNPSMAIDQLNARFQKYFVFKKFNKLQARSGYFFWPNEFRQDDHVACNIT